MVDPRTSREPAGEKCAVVVLAGDFILTPAIERALRTADLIIAADGGADRLSGVQLLPDVLVGDLDSISGERLASLQAQKVEVLQFSADKDATDAELAVFEAAERGATTITILGGRGGPRADHELANLLLLIHPRLKRLDVRYLTATTEVRALWPGSHDLHIRPGSTVSLIPMTEIVRGVTISGVRWPLSGNDLALGSTYTVSNEVIDPEIGIEIASGAALLFRDLSGDVDAETTG